VRHAREEWLPVRRPDMASPERVYRSIRIGGLAELFMLDTRTRRDEPVPPPASGKKGRTALGPEQKAWLFDALRSSKARWRLIGNPSVMSRTWNDSLPKPVRDALVKVKLIDTDGTGPDYDQWDGYPHERRELLDVISKLPESNVVVLSGDVHVGLAAELAETPSEPPVAVEFVNTSLTSQNLDDKMGWSLRKESLEIEKAVLAGMPHLRYIDLDSHGYSIVQVDREELRFEWWTVDALETRSAGTSLAASIAVRHGEPRLIVQGEPAGGAAAPTRRTRTPAKAAKAAKAAPGTAKAAPGAAKAAKAPKAAPGTAKAAKPTGTPAKAAKAAPATSARPAKPAKPVPPPPSKPVPVTSKSAPPKRPATRKPKAP
jgi:alkaline phosphatase D